MKTSRPTLLFFILAYASFMGWRFFHGDAPPEPAGGSALVVVAAEPARTAAPVVAPVLPAKVSLLDRIALARLEDFGPLLDDISRLPDAEQKRKLTALLVERWIKKNPADFKAFLAALGKGGEYAERFLPLLGQSFVDLGGKVTGDFFYPLAASYGAVNFAEAIGWSGKVVASGREAFPCIEMFGTLTAKNPAEALALALALPPNAIRPLVMEHVAYNWDKNDVSGALAVAGQLPANEQGNFVREYFRAMTYSDTARAAATLSGTTDPLILQNAAGSVGETSYYTAGPRQAMAWADTLATPEARRAAVDAIYGAWSQNNPLGAVTDAQTRYPQYPDLANQFFGQAVTGRNDEEVMQALAQVQSPDWQSDGYLGAFTKMIQFEPAANMDRLLQFTSGAARDRALYALVMAATDSAPALAVEWAGQISDPNLAASLPAIRPAGNKAAN